LSEIIHTTGITGFIGRNLLPALLEKYEAVINHKRFSSKNRYTLYTSNIKKDMDSFDSYKSSTLLHLATHYNPKPKNEEEIAEINEANYLFPKNIASGFEKVISISSYIQLLDDEYQNFYSETKTCFNQWCESRVDDLVKIYLFDSFGTGDTRNKVVDAFIKSSIVSENIQIPNSEIIINLTEVSEIVEGILNSIDLPGGDYSIKSKNDISLENLAKKIVEIEPTKTKIIKSGSAMNLLDKINALPENIYRKTLNSDLADQLKKRFYEIKTA
jgi:nucleoside-diphosphate-sugar epimerase